MRITSIPSLYRNLRRWQEIILVLRRYGLADWLSHLKVDFIRDWIKDSQGVPLSSYSRETRVRLALSELGPTFIKLGQVLSLRPDLVGPELATELQQLQTHGPADPWAQVQKTIESELKQPAKELFSEFEVDPIASASIGQVHTATLPEGTAVVVKVQHQDIQRVVREDLEVLRGLAVLAQRLPELAVWQPVAIVEQLSRSLNRELSFQRELRNLEMFRLALQDNRDLAIPTPYAELSSARVLTMDRIDGTPLTQWIEKAQATPDAAQQLARQIAELYIEMIFELGYYHADPHPGNLLILPDGKIGLLDFGMVGRIDEKLRETIESMLIAVASRDAALLTALIKRVGKPPLKLDDSLLSIDVSELIATHGMQSLSEFDLAAALNDMTDLLHRHRILLPPQTAMLLKTLITLEGTLHLLAPRFSLMEVMQPFIERVWRNRLSPRRQFRKIHRISWELENLLEKLPTQVSGLLDLVQEGKLDVQLSHRGLSPSINRLVVGIWASSLFLGSSVLLAYKVPPLLFTQRPFWGVSDFSLLGGIGVIASLLTSMRLLWAINRSGHLDPREEEETH
jgi:ubiquinone biosynthesis protein